MNQSKGNLYFTTITETMFSLREKNDLIKNLMEQLNIKTAVRSFGTEQGEIIQLKQKLDTIKREYIVITYNLINDLNSIDKMAPYLSIKQQKTLFEINEELQTYHVPNIRLMEKNSGQTSEFYQSSPYFVSSDQGYGDGYGDTYGMDYNDDSNLVEIEEQSYASEHYYDLDVRNQQMRELQREAETVKYLFNKVTELVNDQGDMVNNFDTHINLASDNVHKAVEELREADNSKKNNRKCCCIIGVFVGVFIFVIIVVGIIILANPSGRNFI